MEIAPLYTVKWQVEERCELMMISKGQCCGRENFARFCLWDGRFSYSMLVDTKSGFAEPQGLNVKLDSS